MPSGMSTPAVAFEHQTHEEQAMRFRFVAPTKIPLC